MRYLHETHAFYRLSRRTSYHTTPRVPYLAPHPTPRTEPYHTPRTVPHTIPPPAYHIRVTHYSYHIPHRTPYRIPYHIQITYHISHRTVHTSPYCIPCPIPHTADHIHTARNFLPHKYVAPHNTVVHRKHQYRGKTPAVHTHHIRASYNTSTNNTTFYQVTHTQQNPVQTKLGKHRPPTTEYPPSPTHPSH